MRVMVTGSRDWRDIGIIQQALTEAQQRWPESYMGLLHGCASGADAIARSIADFFGWNIEDFWPDYSSYSFAEANKVRNLAMVESRPDLVLAFPTRGSRGTWHAVNAAKRAGYVEGETLLIFSESKEVRQSKSTDDFGTDPPTDPYLWESGT